MVYALTHTLTCKYTYVYTWLVLYVSMHVSIWKITLCLIYLHLNQFENTFFLLAIYYLFSWSKLYFVLSESLKPLNRNTTLTFSIRSPRHNSFFFFFSNRYAMLKLFSFNPVYILLDHTFTILS